MTVFPRPHLPAIFALVWAFAVTMSAGGSTLQDNGMRANPCAWSPSPELVSADPVLSAAAGVRIMPLGDSITYGSGGTNAGYRGQLNTLLNTAGITHQFVGSAVDNVGSLPSDQQHHEGHSGYTITGGGRSGILDNINTWLGASGADPNIILLMIGTNDVTTYANTLATVPLATANLNTLISRISNKTTGLKPNAQLIIAEITPIVNAGQDTLVQAYNQSIISLITQHRTLGENVTLVDMHVALNASTDMTDNLHPNTAGYNKMAQVWLNGIKALPEPSSFGLLVLAGMTLARVRPLRQSRSQIWIGK